jgi:hypothetical protein
MPPLNISLDPYTPPGSGGGGPEGDPGYPRVALRAQGLLALAFGFALGIALVVLLWLLPWFLQSSNNAPPNNVKAFLDQLLWWKVFLFGFIGGTLISAIYNMLVVRRLNLFGLESSVD